MNGGQHLLIGTASTGLGLWLTHTVLGVQIEPSTVWIALGMASVGSLAPDIDHPRAIISHGIPKELRKFGCSLLLIAVVFAIFPVLSSVSRGENALEAVISGYNNSPLAQLLLPIGASIVIVGLALFLTSEVISSLFSHRGATHSLFVAVLVTGLATVGIMFIGIVWWFGLFFGWGYLTHLVADATTEMGLPELFWPISKGW